MAKKKITLEILAGMVKRGFDETAKKADVDKRFEAVDKRFELVDRRLENLTQALIRFIRATDDNFRHVNARLDRIRDDISDLPVIREELRGLRSRVERLERKAGAAR